MADTFRFEPTAMSKLQAQYDVVIIGSGGAGITSAIQASELGLKPVIFEKMPKIGGNTTRASSGMNAAETSVQLRHRIVDSFAAFYDETLQGGGQLNDPALLHYFTEHSALAIDWLAEHDINLDDVTITGGMTTKRTHRPASLAAIGGYLINGLLKQAAQSNVPIFTDTEVTKLQLTNHQITGVEIDINHEKNVIEAPTVIIASGGFGANQALIGQYRPELVDYKTTNQPGAMGDGIKLATQIGAQTVDMQQIQIHPTVQQDQPHTYLIGEAVRGEGAILVNTNGNRFINELDTRKVVSDAINQLGGTGAYLIFDQSICERVKAIEFYDSIGLVTTGKNLTELATQIKVIEETLKQTVKTWNSAVDSQNDPEFGRTTGMTTEINQGPFFAIHVSPAIHYTMGGLKINPQTQVLNEKNQAIDGLYAAGEVVGGLHGNNRIGGNSIAEIVVFGRQAGQQVFKYLES